MIITRFALPRIPARSRTPGSLFEHFFEWRCPLVACVIAQQLLEKRS